ncbi:hypothetical protein M3Y97_00179900 [Aphelenchoides bicaudatus]|nr:hypothetical protein M3Y97_00179900 [Aphelenchoides bicaudatus]
MHSGGEQKIDKAISLHKQVFINHTINHIIRVYPSAWRVDSSNFSPLNFMVAGCQMVSMNFQTAGTPMQYYDSFFFDQLGQTSGYVLKPPVLLQQIPKEGPYKAYRLEISLFSAQFLNLLSCKCRKGMGKVTVRISLYDLPHNFVINKFEIVSTKSEEGFNTAFEANSVIFDRIITPELTMLHIRVSDESGSKLAQRFLRVNQVQSGYRHLTLRNRYNRPEPAFLFGRFKLVEYEPDESIRELYMDPLRDRFNIEEAKKLANARDKQLRWAQKTGDQNKNDSLVSWESQATNDSFGHSSRKSSSCASPRMSRGSLNILDGSGSNSRSPSTAFNFDNDRKVPTLPPKPCVNSGSVASINSSDIPQPKISISTFYTDDFDEKEDAIKF